MVFDLRGGAISRIRGYLDHDEALKAVGLAGRRCLMNWRGYACAR